MLYNINIFLIPWSFLSHIPANNLKFVYLKEKNQIRPSAWPGQQFWVKKKIEKYVFRRGIKIYFHNFHKKIFYKFKTKEDIIYGIKSNYVQKCVCPPKKIDYFAGCPNFCFPLQNKILWKVFIIFFINSNVFLKMIILLIQTMVYHNLAQLLWYVK